MPQAIATWAAAKATALLASTSLAGTSALPLIGGAVYATTYAGVIAATSYAASALAGGTPSAEAAQGSMRQSIQPRIEAYGYGKLGGQYLLWEAQGQKAFDVVAFHHGQAGSIDEIWSHDHILTINGAGWVQHSDEYGGGNSDLIHVETRLGLPTETAYSAIASAIPGIWTSSHRGDGIASLGADYRHGRAENLMKDFPNGDPSWSAVGAWKLVTDPRTDAVSATRNTALQIMDLLTSETGLAQDYATTIAPVLDHWMGEMDICDEPVPLKAGGTAPRYESFVFRALSEDPVEALKKLLNACDGRLLIDDAGCWRLWVGKYRAPTVFLTEADIVGYDVAGDDEDFDVVNELVPSFKSPAHKWSMVETDPWRNSADAGMRGEVKTTPMDLEAVTLNSQARRVAKREMSRLLAPIKGRLDCKLSAARAMGHRWIGVDFPELGFDNVVIEVEEGGQTSLQGFSVTIPFVLADPQADEWNAATEEGDGPQSEDRLVREALDAPVITDVEVFEDSAGEGGAGVRLRVTLTGPDRDDLVWAARWRVAGTSSWVEGTFVDIDPSGGVEIETGFVAADELEVEAAYTTGGGSLSPWSEAYEIDASVSPPAYAVPPPSDLAASSPSAGTLRVQYRDPVSPVAYCIVRTNTSPTLTGATAEPDEPPAGIYTPRSFDLSRPAGTYYVWVTAYDAADVPSADLGPAGPVTVT